MKNYGLNGQDNCAEKNNISILKIMETQIQSQNKELLSCFYKIKNLASELSLADGLKYLKGIFQNIVKS